MNYAIKCSFFQVLHSAHSIPLPLLSKLAIHHFIDNTDPTRSIRSLETLLLHSRPAPSFYFNLLIKFLFNCEQDCQINLLGTQVPGQQNTLYPLR